MNTVQIAVGSTCLKDFMGGKSVESMLFSMSWMKLVDEFAGDRGERIKPIHKLETVLACAIKSIADYGYVTVQYARDHYSEYADFNPIATKDRMWAMIYGDVANGEYGHSPSEVELEEARKAIEWVKTSIDASKSEYNQNICRLAEAGFVKDRFMGFAVSIIPQYRKFVDQNKKFEKKSFAPSNHVGTVDEKIEIELTYVSTHGFSGFYGWTSFHRFVDANNNIIIWKTTKDCSFVENQKYNVKATVKEHTEYKETKQTLIIRPNFKG